MDDYIYNETKCAWLSVHHIDISIEYKNIRNWNIPMDLFHKNNIIKEWNETKKTTKYKKHFFCQNYIQTYHNLQRIKKNVFDHNNPIFEP